MAPHVSPEEARRVHLARINDLARCQNNEDHITAERMARNLMAGGPAYWFKGQTSPAAVVVSMACCNEHNNSFLKALEAFCEQHRHRTAIEVLDGMIPLNAEAEAELALCYRLQSTFREDLADRERQAIYDPVYFPHMSSERREAWREVYGEIQRRYEERQRDAHWSRPVVSAKHLDAVALGREVV